jgi:diadenylate cyclase
MVEAAYIHVLDIVLGTIVLRMAFGWLLSYPRLLRLIFMLVSLVALGFLVQVTQLPFSGLLFWLLVAPVSLVVLLSFLPELGKIYHSASRGHLFGNFRNESENFTPILATTLEELVRRRYGALIAIPTSGEVDSFIHGGEEVDACLNSSLLVSLFNPDCPRHDGAAVIINNRLKRIGAFLPLASAEGSESQMGTRHLAALGLTQVSESHVFVVSEERQVISYAHDGKLTPLPLTCAGGLDKALKEIFGKKSDREPNSKRKILAYALWIGSFLLALTCSFNINAWKAQLSESSTVLTSVEARVEIASLPEGLFVDVLKPTEVTLFLKAPQIFKPIGGMTVLVNLKEAKAGKYTLNLSEAIVAGLPRDAKVERFDPSFIQYTVAETRNLKISIEKPEFTGLSKSLKLGGLKIEQESFRAEVRDTKWKLGASVKPQIVDLSTINKAGIYRLPLIFNLPPTIKPAGGTELKFDVSVELKAK